MLNQVCFKLFYVNKYFNNIKQCKYLAHIYNHKLLHGTKMEMILCYFRNNKRKFNLRILHRLVLYRVSEF